MPLLITLGAEATPMATALSDISTIVTTALNILTANTVLMVFFCGGLLGVGFWIIKQAKRSARS